MDVISFVVSVNNGGGNFNADFTRSNCNQLQNGGEQANEYNAPEMFSGSHQHRFHSSDGAVSYSIPPASITNNFHPL